MPAKLGLPAVIIAFLLAVASPALANETATTTPESTTTTSPPVALEEPEATPWVVGPAVASGDTPARGTQLQLTPPPPRPDSPFVPPADGGSGRRIVYSKTKQTVWVYDDGNTIIKTHRVSGRQTPRDPSPGVYRVYSRSLQTHSINNPSITWKYMVRFAKGARDGNIGFHEIPYQYGRPVQTVGQLGQALSGGCVRQSVEDAIWMWNWAGIGTVVIVTP